MRFLFLNFYFIIISFFWQLIFAIFGRILYFIGFQNIGHKMIAMSIAGDFGFCKRTRKWLYKKCPHNNKDKCKLWTCDNYKNCKNKILD